MTATINLDGREAFDALPDVFFWPVPMVHDAICEKEWPNVPCTCAPDPEWVKAGEPCEHARCQQGRILTTDRHGSLWVNCPNCHAGKPRIAITVPCGPEPHGIIDPDGNEVCEANGRFVVPDVWAVIEHGPIQDHSGGTWGVICRKVQP